jgi:hypothetical protein
MTHHQLEEELKKEVQGAFAGWPDCMSACLPACLPASHYTAMIAVATNPLMSCGCVGLCCASIGLEELELIMDKDNPEANRGFAFAAFYNNACAEAARRKYADGSHT